MLFIPAGLLVSVGVTGSGFVLQTVGLKVCPAPIDDGLRRTCFCPSSRVPVADVEQLTVQFMFLFSNVLRWGLVSGPLSPVHQFP